MPFLSGGSLAPFFALTFAWSWFFFGLAVPAFRTRGFDGAGPWPYVALLLGAYGPTLTAVALTWRGEGRAGVRRLLGGFVRWRGRWRALLGALLLPFLIRLAAVGLFVLATTGRAPLDFSRAGLALVVLAVSVPFGPLAEEVGWRGFAQPRLVERFGPLATGILLGLAWTAWHIPLFFSPAGTTISGKPLTVGAVAFYLALLTGLSLVMVWLARVTDRALLAGFLVHLGFNAEIYRFFFDLSTDDRYTIEQWALVPLSALVGWLVVSGRLGRRADGATAHTIGGALR